MTNVTGAEREERKDVDEREIRGTIGQVSKAGARKSRTRVKRRLSRVLRDPDANLMETTVITRYTQSFLGRPNREYCA